MPHPLLKKHLRNKFFFFFFGIFCQKFYHADLDSREQQVILLKKVEIFRPKLRFSYICFSGEKIGTILSRCSRLSRTSRAPSRLIRPRLIDCEAGRDRQMKTFPVFGRFLFRTSTWPKKSFFSRPAYYSSDPHPKKPIAGFS